MTWQSDCVANGGTPTVLPYDMPLDQALPELAALPIVGASLAGVGSIPSWPACRVPNLDGSGYTYTPAPLSLADRLALVESQASDLYYEYVAGPIASGALDVATAVKAATVGPLVIVAALVAAALVLPHLFPAKSRD